MDNVYRLYSGEAKEADPSKTRVDWNCDHLYTSQGEYIGSISHLSGIWLPADFPEFTDIDVPQWGGISTGGAL